MASRAGAAAQAARSARDRREQLANAEQERSVFKTEKEKDDWFLKHDKNGNGTFEKPEFMEIIADIATDKEAVKDVPQSMYDKVFDGKDVLDRDTVYPAVQRVLSFVNARSRLIKLFRECDLDGNNFLEKNELKGLLQKAAPPKYVVQDDDCTYIIGKCDVDQDGRISLDELGPAVAAWMANCKAIAARGPPPSEKGGGSSACVLL